MKISVILPAAGQSKRFNAAAAAADAGAPAKSKLEIALAGKPVFLHAIELFINREDVGQVILAVDPDKVEEFRFRHGDKLGFHGVQIVPGGRVERWETVLNAINAVDEDCTHIAIHDAARPLATKTLIDRVFTVAASRPAVIPGLPVSATLKRTASLAMDDMEKPDPLDALLGSVGKVKHDITEVVATVDRTGVVEVQTPQVFEKSLLRRAYAQITEGRIDGKGITDDAGLVEALGQTVYVVEGEAVNLKITRPGDMELAEAIAAGRKVKSASELAKKRLFGGDEEE